MRERLLTNPDYEPKPVAWIIHVGDGGQFAWAVPTAEGKKMNVPRRAGKTSAALADFLVDKSEYVLGVCRRTNLPSPAKLKSWPNAADYSVKPTRRLTGLLRAGSERGRRFLEQ